MNKIHVWNTFFEGRKLGSFYGKSFRFQKVVCKSRILTQKLCKKIRESCNTYSHVIMSWKKWFSTKSKKWLMLLQMPFCWLRTFCIAMWICFFVTGNFFLYLAEKLQLKNMAYSAHVERGHCSSIPLICCSCNICTTKYS